MQEQEQFLAFAALPGGGVSNSFQTTGSGGSATLSGALVVPNELHDDGGNYNTSNGRYTAPSDGFYLFIAAALVTGSAGTELYFTKNGSNTYGTDNFGYNGVGNQNQLNAYQIISLSSGDYINVYSITIVFIKINFLTLEDANYRINIMKYLTQQQLNKLKQTQILLSMMMI